MSKACENAKTPKHPSLVAKPADFFPQKAGKVTRTKTISHLNKQQSLPKHKGLHEVAY